MNLTAARLAVEHPGTKLPLQIRLHLQEFKSQHLGLEGDRMISCQTSGKDLID
jgi:hypothetical protein